MTADPHPDRQPDRERFSRGNIADALRTNAARAPDAIALTLAQGAATRAAYRYSELDRASEALAHGLLASGLAPGDRAALMVRPGFDFFALMFALFKAGLVPVLIDPGIDRRALRTCLAEADPAAFIGIALAQWARRVLDWAPAARLAINVGRGLFPAGLALAAVRARGANAIDSGKHLPETSIDDVAAILFTSGSTGIPKGVVYRHRHFIAQIEMLGRAFGIAPGTINLPTFPPFALFDPGLGIASVIADMDPRRPARADPARLIATIGHFKVGMMFGSPALLDTLSRHGERTRTTLPTLKRVLSAGAPVRPEIIARCYPMLPADAELWTPYGATECLPVAIVEGREVLSDGRAATAAGAGILVGRPVAPNRVRIIAIGDDAIPTWADARELPAGTIGEITVCGPSTTDAYFNREPATRLAKIVDGADIVHRMGDLGWFDEAGRLWYVGRKSERVVLADRTLYTEQVEGVFNAHPAVFRSALVGIGDAAARRAVLIVELEPGVRSRDWPKIRAALLDMRGRATCCEPIAEALRHPRFPVDIRHNAKIGRPALARWAEARLRRRPARAADD